MANSADKNRNLTISLSPEAIRNTRLLATRRSTSISGLLAEQIEVLTQTEETYRRSERAALALLETGLHLGGVGIRRLTVAVQCKPLLPVTREYLHER
jgi:hypothetical protein